mmetsp:Transcript_1825/g.2636  ORF Transcript_1825/g.2636 Transcript_1825/m.2636 type:complete len:82 (-) Transcript_1825:446-691(-)
MKCQYQVMVPFQKVALSNSKSFLGVSFFLVVTKSEEEGEEEEEEEDDDEWCLRLYEFKDIILDKSEGLSQPQLSSLVLSSP